MAQGVSSLIFKLSLACVRAAWGLFQTTPVGNKPNTVVFWPSPGTLLSSGPDRIDGILAGFIDRVPARDVIMPREISAGDI